MMVEGDRVEIIVSPYEAHAFGRAEASGIIITLARGAQGYICAMNPKGWEGAALVEIASRRYLVPYQNLAFPADYVKAAELAGRKAAALGR